MKFLSTLLAVLFILSFTACNVGCIAVYDPSTSLTASTDVTEGSSDTLPAPPKDPNAGYRNTTSP